MSGDQGLIKTKTQNSSIIFFTFSKDPILRGQVNYQVKSQVGNQNIHVIVILTQSINCHKKCKCACNDRFPQTLPSIHILFDLNRQPNCVFPREKILYLWRKTKEMHVIEKVVVNNFENPRKSVCENQNLPIKFSKNATHEIELNAREYFHFFPPLNLK